jgi:ABC-2 type transport system ATP-binding protein
MSNIILKTNDLCKYYRGTKALDQVNLTVRKGDIYGFVGKNGAGKTTLIRLITGVAEPTKGDYELFGITDLKQIIKARAKMAAVVENPALHLGLTAYDNMRLQCTLLGITKDVEKTIKQLLTQVDLIDLLVTKKKKVKNFSLGMKQRLGIAMALLSNPEFLVLDEPNNGLDPEGIRDMRDLLLKLNRERQVTILVSSHILGELSRLATTYGFIDKGRLVKEISAHELQKESRKALVISVDDSKQASKALKENDIKDISILPTGIKVYTDLPIKKIISILSNNDIEFSAIKEENDDLEAYFLKIIGHGNHD